MNAYERAQQLGLTGTDAEIVTKLKPTTATAISLAWLMEMLNFRGMLRKTDGSGGQERWQGTLQNLKGALVSLGQSAAVEAYETWFSHVTNPRQVSWDTSNPDYAKAFGEMEASFAGVETMPTVEDFAAVAALGGGRPFVSLTVEQYSEQRQASIDAEAAADAARIAAESERQTQARIAAQRAAIRSVEAESIVSDAPLTLDAAVDAIRAALTTFGGFA